MNEKQTAATNEVLKVLAQEAKQLKVAQEALAVARAQFELAKRRYAGVRDLAQRYVGASPYGPEVVWPVPRQGEAYRFVEMPVGQMALAVLAESGRAMTAEEIQAVGRTGGVEYLPLRPLVAALTRFDRVEQLPDGRFKLKEVSDDDLPFE